MDMTNIAVLLIALIGAIIASVIVPWIKSKTTLEQQDIISSVASVAVFAAQQLFTDNGEKKSYALDYVSKALKNYGITLSMDEISTQIESALKSIKLSLDEDSDW